MEKVTLRCAGVLPPLAVNYILQEAKDNKFQPVENSYPSEEASYDVENRGASRLFYRVMARNSTGDSPWSNVEHVDVVVALAGIRPESRKRRAPDERFRRVWFYIFRHHPG